jgi:hypothetical protein
MTQDELIEYLLSELPNAWEVGQGTLRRIAMRLDDRTVHLVVQCGAPDCLAEQAYQAQHRNDMHPARYQEPPFADLREALGRLAPAPPILDQDALSILVQGDDATLRIIVSAS